LRTVSFWELCVSETTRGLPVLAWRVSASRRSRTLLRQTYKRPFVVAPLGLRRLCARARHR
jgi:hypothetical protein